MWFEVLGTEERMRRLKELLTERGHAAALSRPAVQKPDVLILPYPFAVRDGMVHDKHPLTPADALKRAGGLVLSGNGLEPYLDGTQAFKHVNLCKDEILQRENAELSAEGAVFYAMRGNGGKALWQSRCLILGYGRLGRALARRLVAFGGRVTIAARSETARLRARSDGMRACSIPESVDLFSDVDFLFNTVPSQILSVNALRRLPSDARLFELAGAPYGYEQAAALSLGLRTAVLPAIPSRYAPDSAARLLYEAVCRAMGGFIG